MKNKYFIIAFFSVLFLLFILLALIPNGEKAQLYQGRTSPKVLEAFDNIKLNQERLPGIKARRAQLEQELTTVITEQETLTTENAHYEAIINKHGHIVVWTPLQLKAVENIEPKKLSFR